MSKDEMGFWEALMKAAFGTDTRCRRERERAETDALVSDVQAKFDQLKKVAPARNIDEALKQIVARQGGGNA